jgi:hypothetical protein
MPRSGEQVRGWRACGSLERGGDSPEGASSPRAWRNFVSAVLYPFNEAESRLRVAGCDRSGGPLGPTGL